MHLYATNALQLQLCRKVWIKGALDNTYPVLIVNSEFLQQPHVVLSNLRSGF